MLILDMHNMTKDYNFEGSSIAMSAHGARIVDDNLWSKGCRLKLAVSDGDTEACKLIREYNSKHKCDCEDMEDCQEKHLHFPNGVLCREGRCGTHWKKNTAKRMRPEKSKGGIEGPELSKLMKRKLGKE